MPVNYEIPPWIRGANPLQAVEAGASLGQRIAESNQRAAFEFAQMQSQQAEFQQRMAMQQQQLEQQQAFQQQQFQADQTIQEQNQMRKDQQLAIENAYKQGQLGLKQQQLDLANKAATEQFQSQVQFQKDLLDGTNQRVAQGMDLEQARRESFQDALFKNPFAKVPPTALRSMTESLGGGAPKWGTSPGGAEYVTESAGGGRQIVKFPPKPGVAPEEVVKKSEVGDITAKIRELDKQLLFTTNEKKKQALRGQLEELSTKRRNLIIGSEKKSPSESAPYKDGVRLRKDNDLYEVRGGLPVLVQKDAFSEQKAQPIPEHPSDE